MTETIDGPLGPFDLEISRQIDVAPTYVWRAWTEARHVKQWLAPKPYEIVACAIDLRPGGRFDTTVTGPDGFHMTMPGCILEVVPERRFVFTDAMVAGWRPAPEPFFTAIVTLEAVDGGTLYRARALHASSETRQKHVERGFEEGWGTVADQLADVAAGLRDNDAR